jgi:hypothetical protein
VETSTEISPACRQHTVDGRMPGDSAFGRCLPVHESECGEPSATDQRSHPTPPAAPPAIGLILGDEPEDALAGFGQTACCTSWMRCRERSSREKRSFSGGQRPGMDFGHGLLSTDPGCVADSLADADARIFRRGAMPRRSLSIDGARVSPSDRRGDGSVPWPTLAGSGS